MGLIDSCKSPEILYMHHSHVILEHIVNESDDNEDASGKRLGPEKFFIHNKVIWLISIELTFMTGQVYVASGLSTKFNFSSLTTFIASLYKAIQCVNNPNMELIFVPQMATCAMLRVALRS
jgi:hypothetical protein